MPYSHCYAVKTSELYTLDILNLESGAGKIRLFQNAATVSEICPPIFS